MKLDDLATLLGADDPGQLLAWWREFQAEEDGDGERFIGWLHEREIIGTRVFCEVLSTGPLQVDPDASSRYLQATDDGPSVRPVAPAERYRFLGVVGAGAMGEVQAVVDQALQRKVAFKRMLPEAVESGDAVARFFQEAQITAQLDHPNVVPVYAMESDVDAEVPAYTMKLVHGVTLTQLVREAREQHQAGAVDDEHARPALLDHFLKVCEAMAYAHSRGVLHRDLKPSNIMVGAWREVYVMDWGIARLFGEAAPERDPEEPDPEEGQAIGTPAYMSPEQAIGHNVDLDAASDQYALGLILFELATLSRCVPGKGFSVVFRAQAGEKNKAVHAVTARRIPKDLSAIIDKATAFEPPDRYPDVSDLAEDLRRFQRREATAARPDNLPRAAKRWLRRHLVLFVLAVLAVLLLAATVTIGALVFAQVALYAASVREDHLTDAIMVVQDRASYGDAYFLELQGLLEGLSAEASHALAHAEPSDGPLYFNADYDDASTWPPDTVTVPRYKTPVSFGWPVFKVAPGVSREEVEPALGRIVRLRHAFRRTYLRSHDEGAVELKEQGVVELLGHQGVPIIWSYVAIEQGVHTSFPGHGGYPAEYDPRVRPWYKLALSNRGPTWGNPYIDVNGLGLILPCVQTIRDEDDRILGVAGVEVTFDYVIDELLDYPDLRGVAEAFLVDSEGRVVIRSSDLGTELDGGLHGNQALDLQPYPVDEVVSAVRSGETGYLEHEGDLVLYQRLKSLGWYLVVTGDSGEMLSLF